MSRAVAALLLQEVLACARGNQRLPEENYSNYSAHMPEKHMRQKAWVLVHGYVCVGGQGFGEDRCQLCAVRSTLLHDVFEELDIGFLVRVLPEEAQVDPAQVAHAWV